MAVRERMRRDRGAEGARLPRRRRLRRCSWPRPRCSRRSRARPARSPRSGSRGSCATRRAAGTRRSARSASSSSRNAILVQGLFLALFIGMLSGVVPSFGAARRGVAADAARGLLTHGAAARATASATCSRAARAPRSRVGVIALVVLATTLLARRWSRACGARSSRRATPRNLIVMRKGADQRRLERAAARGLPGAALLRGHRARRATASRSSRPSWSCSRSSARATAGARTCSCAASSRSRSRCTTRCGSSRAACSSPSSGEVVVGRGVAGRYAGATLGEELEFGRGTWKVVGRLRERRRRRSRARSGSTCASSRTTRSARCPTRACACASRRGADLDALARRIDDDPRCALEAERETDYYAEQAESANALYVLVIGLAVLAGIGAVFGATNTLYAAVQARTAEIGTLRALGFSRGAILRRVPDRVAADGAARLRGRRRARVRCSRRAISSALGGVGFAAATFTTNVIAAARRARSTSRWRCAARAGDRPDRRLVPARCAPRGCGRSKRCGGPELGDGRRERRAGATISPRCASTAARRRAASGRRGSGRAWIARRARAVPAARALRLARDARRTSPRCDVGYAQRAEPGARRPRRRCSRARATS